MPSILVDTKLLDDPRVYELAMSLDISQEEGIGHLVSIWLWAARHGKSGDTRGISPGAFAYLAGWKGDADRFCEAMLASGFIDDREQLTDLTQRGMAQITPTSTDRVRRHRERLRAAGS